MHAAAQQCATTDLETLGRRHARFEFSLQDLGDRLNGAEWWDDEDFTDYGLTLERLADLRAWVLDQAVEIDARLYVEAPDETEPGSPGHAAQGSGLPPL